VLLKADTKPSTAEMYKQLDALDYKKPNIDAFVDANKKGDLKEICQNMQNSFAAVWQNNSTEKMLLETSANAVSLSGSGPTWFGYYVNKKDAKKAQKALKTAENDCYLVKPVNCAVKFE